MSDSNKAEVPVRSGLNPIATISIALLLFLIGGVVGARVVGPRLQAGSVTASDSDQVGGAKVAREAPVLFRLDNVIINPAGTQGSRVMIISIAFEVNDKVARESLANQEVPLRDAIIQMLEQETLESLGRPGAREALKGKLRDIALRVIPGSEVTVYIPQFLIQ